MFATSFDIIIFVFGMASTVFTSLMNVPLAWKVFKTRDTQSLSYGTLVMTITAAVLWVVYSTMMLFFDGYPLISSLPILICNTLLLFIVSYILIVKLNNDRVARAKAARENNNVSK